MLANVKQRLDALSSRQQALLKELEPASESKFLDFYVRLVPRLLNAERCSVFIHDPATGKVWLKAGTSVAERGIEVSVADSIAGQVISGGKPVIMWDLESRDGAHRQVDTTTGFVTRQIVCVPIHTSDGTKVTGAIQALNKKDAQFSEEDQELLTEVGQHFQGIVESIYLGQEAVSLTKTAVRSAAHAVVTGAIAGAAAVFVVTVLSIYAGLPLLLFG